MKTVREWFEELPDGIREKAIFNGDNDEPNTMDSTEYKLSLAISGGFVWSRTPEGGEFWLDVVDKLKYEGR